MMDYQTNETNAIFNPTSYSKVAFRKRNQRIKVKLWRQERIIVRLMLLLLCLVSAYTVITMDYGNVKLTEAVSAFFSNMFNIFLRPQLSERFTTFSLVESLGITIGLSVLTTVIGAFLAFFLSLLASRNLSSGFLSNTIRGLMSFIRAVPTILWVMIFSILIGLGANAAIIGMSFHSIAYLTKVYSESIEEMESGMIESLKACGASWWQIVFQSVLPHCFTTLLSWTFIRFEINFTNAIAVGAAAGAGGLGFQLTMASNFYFDFREIGVMVYMILTIAVLLEFISLKLKEKYIVKT
ncbi:ABC transporter permease subunit [Enterococcus faecium]|nr:ABC transporter permease subunit [Enterococcus faecium]